MSALSITAKLSSRYQITLTMTPDRHITCEWDPHFPPQHSLTEEEVEHYHQARDTLLAQFAKSHGLSALMVIDI